MRKSIFVLAVAAALIIGAVPVSAQVPGPGGPYNSAFTIQNLESQIATCVFSLYNASGAAAYTSSSISVPASGSYFVYVGSVSVSSGQYSAVISCDRQVAAVANTSDTTKGSSYSGVGTSGVATTSYAPGVYKNYYGFYSNVIAQNTTSGPINITLDVYAPGSATAAATVIKSSVPANASVSFDLNGTDFSALAQGLYSAKVTGTGSVATEANIWSNAGQLYAYNPFGGGTTLAYAPVIMNNYYGYNTALTVQNLGSSSTAVTVTYSSGLVKTATVAGNSSQLFYTPNEGLAVGFIGGAKIQSSGQPIVALVNESSGSNRAASYEGFKAGSLTANAPIVLKRYYSYSTSITCQNVGSANTNITVLYSNAATESLSNVAANGSVVFYQPNMAGLPDAFNGSAVITSSSQPIVCVVNEDQVSNTASQDWLYSYDAIQQ